MGVRDRPARCFPCLVLNESSLNSVAVRQRCGQHHAGAGAERLGHVAGQSVGIGTGQGNGFGLAVILDHRAPVRALGLDGLARLVAQEEERSAPSLTNST